MLDQGGLVAGADHEQPRCLHHGGLLPEVPNPTGIDLIFLDFHVDNPKASKSLRHRNCVELKDQCKYCRLLYLWIYN